MLTVIDIMGRVVFKESGGASASLTITHEGYFTKDLDWGGCGSGMYIVTVTTDKERLGKRFAKN